MKVPTLEECRQMEIADLAKLKIKLENMAEQLAAIIRAKHKLKGPL